MFSSSILPHLTIKSSPLDAEIDLPTAQLVWPVLERALAGKTWEGKEVVLKALVKFSGQAQKLWQDKEELRSLMKVWANMSPLSPHDYN